MTCPTQNETQRERIILITSSIFVHVDILIALNKMDEIELIGFWSVQNRFDNLVEIPFVHPSCSVN